MTDLLSRLRDVDTTRRIGESYADTHERRQRDRDEAADRIEKLEAALRIAQRGLDPYASYEAQLDARVVVDGICAALEEAPCSSS